LDIYAKELEIPCEDVLPMILAIVDCLGQQCLEPCLVLVNNTPHINFSLDDNIFDDNIALGIIMNPSSVNLFSANCIDFTFSMILKFKSGGPAKWESWGGTEPPLYLYYILNIIKI